MECCSISNNSIKARVPYSSIKFFDSFLLQEINRIYKFNENGVTCNAIIRDSYRLNLLHVYYLFYIIFRTVIYAYEFDATSESCSIIHLQFEEDRRLTNSLFKFLFRIFSKEKQTAGTPGASSADNNAASSESLPEETGTGENSPSASPSASSSSCPSFSLSSTSSDASSNENVASDGGDPNVASSVAADVPLIPIMVRTDDGELIQWALLSSRGFSGYASLARLVRRYCPYESPANNVVHVLSPWLRHKVLYLDENNEVLHPSLKWAEFSPKLKQIHLSPRDDNSFAIVTLPGMAINIPGYTWVELELFYWIRFQRTSKPEKVFVVRRRAVRTYSIFLWIINGLWASWHNYEPMDAENITEINVVSTGYSFNHFPADSIKFINHSGEEMKQPRFLASRWQAAKQLNINTGTNENEDGYPDDPNYENTWDFLGQVLEVIVTWSGD